MLKDGQAAVFNCLERCTSFQETTKPCKTFYIYVTHMCIYSDTKLHDENKYTNSRDQHPLMILNGIYM